MKKLMLIVGMLSCLFTAGLIVPAQSVLAVDVVNEVCENPNATELPSFCNDNRSEGENPIFGPNSVLAKVINVLSWIVGVVAVFVIIISGLKMMTSMGDPTGVATARGGIIYAAIAIIITLGSQLVVRLLLSKL